MIRKIRFDSSTDKNKFNRVSAKNNMSFNRSFKAWLSDDDDYDRVLLKYGIPEEQEKRIQDDAIDNIKIRIKHVVLKYSIPESKINNDTDDVSSRKEVSAKKENPFPDDDFDEMIEEGLKRRNKNFQNTDEEPQNIAPPKEKPSYFKRLWYAILGKDL